MVFSTPVSVDEVALNVRPALDGEIEAQSKILRYFAAFIRACARKFFLSEEDRLDLLQEGQIALFRAIQRYRPDRGPFAPYARLVIRRHINRMAEKMIHHNAVERTHQHPDDFGDHPALMETRNPETEVMEVERWKEISLNVKKNLTRLESNVLAMFLQGLSYREMARQIKRSTKSVDNALRRIRTKVKA